MSLLLMILRNLVDQLAPPLLFSQLRSMDYEQLFVEFNVGVARQTCLGVEVRMRLEHKIRGRKRFEGKCAIQDGWLKERDAEIASLKARLSLKEDEVAEAIRLRGQVAVVEAAEATRASELNGLKERNAVLEGQVAALEFATVSKDAEPASSNAQIAKVTQYLSNLQLSCNELSIKAASLESEKDGLVGQVSMLETTCSRIREQVSGYELFKEQIEGVQDEQVKILSNKVACIDVDLIEMALHLDEEFYPRYSRWAGGRCRSWEGRTGLAEVAAYNLVTEANYVSVVSALCNMDFPLLAQLASHKDTSISDLMALLRLEGPAAETPEAFQLQPSPKQLMLPIYRDVAARRLSLSDAMIPLIEPLSAENLIGEASTSGVPATATTTALSTTFIHTSSVPPVSVADYEVLDVGPSTKVPSPPAIVF
ncbi:hypothetical protein Tco_1362863 [Tanacetum coccineum]